MPNEKPFEPSTVPIKPSAPRGHFDSALYEYRQLGDDIFKESGDIARRFQTLQDEFRTFGADVEQSFAERKLEQAELDFGTKRKVARYQKIGTDKASEIGTIDMLTGLAGMGFSYLMPQFSPQIQGLLGNTDLPSGFEVPFIAPRQEQDSIYGFLPYDFA
jgi:hypothetical protein